MGPMRVKQPMPADGLEQISPFLLIHHTGPEYHEPRKLTARLSPHPHRGFEPVTFLFQGGIHHKDSTGAEGFLTSGDVQWMTAGSGIVHSEGPSREFIQQGGWQELIQLWVNLPRQHKMTPPKYQDIKVEQMPEIIEAEGKIRVKLVAGSYREFTGPAATFTPIEVMMVNFRAGGKAEMAIPGDHNALIYLLDGTIRVNDQTVEKLHLVHFRKDGGTIAFETLSEGKLLLLAGEPIAEPMVQHGPFVMNNRQEILEAMQDYEAGKMGVLTS